MKKIVAVILVIFSAAFLSACKNKPADRSERISQLRGDIFRFENDDFDLTAYSEAREYESENDGFVGKKANYMLFRITFKKTETENAEIKFTAGGKEYTATFTFNPISKRLSAETEVSEFPEKNFSALVTAGEEEFPAELRSVKRDDAITYSQAIAECESREKEKTERITNGENYEIKVRLIENNGYNFWYVGFADADNEVSFLVDGASGDILAAKEN